MDIDERYYPYSKYLKKRYGEKVYKLPVNLPVTCPNRISGAGCSFCAETGTGFEAMDSAVSVTEQLMSTRKYIEKRYHAHKFIAYFQNYTNTFMPLDIFQKYMLEASKVPDIVEIAISTRPDCIREDYLDVLNRIRETTGIQITIELGLQTVNYHTLKRISRGHTLAEYIDAVLRISRYGYDTISLCKKEEYLNRLIAFLEHLNPDIAVERLFSRIPEKDAVFCNWNTSWWKLRDELLLRMEEQNSFQGKKLNYLDGAALRLLDNKE